MIQCACWEWQRDDRGFSPYTPEESHQLETAFTARAGMQVVADYVVDFSNMSQRRKVGGERYFYSRIHRRGSRRDTSVLYWGIFLLIAMELASLSLNQRRHAIPYKFLFCPISNVYR